MAANIFTIKCYFPIRQYFYIRQRRKILDEVYYNVHTKFGSNRVNSERVTALWKMDIFGTFTIFSEITPTNFLLGQFTSNFKEEKIFSMICTTHMQNYNQIYPICTEYWSIYHMHVFNKWSSRIFKIKRLFVW